MLLAAFLYEGILSIEFSSEVRSLITSEGRYVC